MNLKISNALDALSSELCRQLADQESGVFQPWYIITQTEGMNSWLKLQLAEQLGIAANYSFLKPNDILFKVYQALGGSYERSLSADQLSLVFFRILAEPEFKKRFPDIASYYPGGNESDRKQLALAQKVADLIDQYQIYRPDMIAEWNDPSFVDFGRGDWQRYLWAKASVLLQDKIADRTRMGQYILNALKESRDLSYLRELIPAVHIFGLSVFTSYHLKLFSALSPHIDFNFYLLNPSPEVYWFEDRSERQLAWMKRKGILTGEEQAQGNSLLVNWGKLIQNTFGMFFQNEELLNAYEVVEAREPSRETLLGALQYDIFHNSAREDRVPISREMLRDGSLSINSCYTAAREVEVLYNYLVNLVDKRRGQLAARDIVVMVSDINAYAPYIRAVFRNAPYQFSFNIADESFTQSQSISSALLALMQMKESGFGAEQVMQLLDSDYIRMRFGIEDAAMLRGAVDRANIRFGLDGELEDETRFVSWRYGLQRIAYGICLAGESSFTTTEGEILFPVDLAEGHASADLVRFCHFVQVLIDSIEERKAARSIGDWALYVEQVLHAMVVDAGSDVEDDYSLIIRELVAYNDMASEIPELLSYEVFCQHFLSKLEAQTSAGNFAAGGITFCSLIPMRSIPFKVVAILGLDFDKFPRKEKPLGFNLMLQDRRKGDRNVKENDKHLFLETMLSASGHFFISYRGQNVKDNTSIPPSALVDELVDYIVEGAPEDVSADELILKHPLHRFSEQYSSGALAVRNYIDDMMQEERVALPARKQQADPEELRELELHKFVAYFRNPFQAYYNNVLGINYSEEEVLLPEEELFDLDTLGRYELRTELLDLPEAATDLPGIREEKVRKGLLPLKNVGHVVLESVSGELRDMRTVFHDLVAGRPQEALQIDLQIAEIRLYGSIPGLYGDMMIYPCFSSRERKHLQTAYLYYLLARASGKDLSMHFVSFSKNESFQALAFSREEALLRLEALLSLYMEGRKQIICYWPGFEDLRLKDLESLSEEGLLKKLKTLLERDLVDKYIRSEQRAGYFEQPGRLESCLRAAELLLKPLATTFTSYPWT